MVVLITESPEEGSRAAARLVSRAIKNSPALRLGLAAGNTPTGLYRNLVLLHQSNELDFSLVRIFSLDEFIALPAGSPNSFRSFFHRHLLDHVNLDPAHLHLLNGQTDEDLGRYCSGYEQGIRDHGGIDLQILGVGRNGHVGFNEPGSSLHSRTRIILLSATTRRTFVRPFDRAEIPEWAMTMGVGTILESRALLLLAFGEQKASAVAKAVEGPLTASLPASAIQLHPFVILVLDQKAASSLKHKKHYQREASRADVLLPEWLRDGEGGVH
ncbi:MAG: nagB [Nitrospira sp.]|jgi:glucosamine-6-phosphate deaminase|nr:nagB [Nitrospira sp.]